MGSMARMIASLGAFGGGYAKGELIGDKLEENRRNAEVRNQIAAVDTNFTPSQTPVASGEDALAAGWQAYKMAIYDATSPEEISQIKTNFKPTLDALEARRQTSAGVENSMGTGASFRQQAEPFSAGEVQGAKTRERAAIYQRAGREDDAARVLVNESHMRELDDQDKIRGAYTSTNNPGTGLSAPMDASASSTGQQSQPGDKDDHRGAVTAYYQRKAPAVIDAFLKLGKVEEAKKYRDFITSEEGRNYAEQWSKGIRKFSIGDHTGALADWQNLYNNQLYDDGRTIKLTPTKENKQVQIDFFDQVGERVHSATYPIDTLAQKAGMALSPEKLVEMRAKSDETRTREVALQDRQIQLEQLRQSGQEVRDDRRDERLGMRLDAQGQMLDRRLSAGGGTTLPQQRSNAEIDAAREVISGMSQSEILRRSQKATNTGRENPDYNPAIARAANLAGRRKIGTDDVFDSRSGSQPAGPQSQGNQTPIQKATAAMSADPAMAGLKLGEQTFKGFKVFDSSGKHVGYFGKQ